eukprot:2342440-Pleurochrysis_carterae.AAC.2
MASKRWRTRRASEKEQPESAKLVGLTGRALQSVRRKQTLRRIAARLQAGALGCPRLSRGLQVGARLLLQQPHRARVEQSLLHELLAELVGGLLMLGREHRLQLSHARVGGVLQRAQPVREACAQLRRLG